MVQTEIHNRILDDMYNQCSMHLITTRNGHEQYTVCWFGGPGSTVYKGINLLIQKTA